MVNTLKTLPWLRLVNEYLSSVLLPWPFILSGRISPNY